ncbi:MAG TPA: Hpt domain-containing protein [Caldimonas sp.]|nr:Hpt domain-containing protein [Caldimonas sp.]
MAEPTIDAAVFAELQATAGEDFARELVDTFLEEAPPMLTALRSAYAAGTAEAFRRSAHSLKSNASTFGASGLAALARDLELQGLAATRAEALDALEAEYARVVPALKALRDG